jgi:hypothetical protein
MSFVVAAPDFLTSAAADLAGIGSQLSEASAAAAAPTSTLLPAAGDEVSAAIAALFAEHGQAYQGLSAQAAAFHTQFVESLTGAAVRMRPRRSSTSTLCNSLWSSPTLSC